MSERQTDVRARLLKLMEGKLPEDRIWKLREKEKPNVSPGIACLYNTTVFIRRLCVQSPYSDSASTAQHHMLPLWQSGRNVLGCCFLTPNGFAQGLPPDDNIDLP